MVRHRSRSPTSCTRTLAPSLLSTIAMSRCWTRAAMSATTLASCAFRSAWLPSANTRTGAIISADTVDPAGEMELGAERGLQESSMISLSVNLFFSTRWRCGDLGNLRGGRWAATRPGNAIAEAAAAIVELGKPVDTRHS